MKYATTLVEGTLLKRYKRFFVDVRLDDGRAITAHCPNTGRMLGCNEPDFRVRVSAADRPSRKLKWTLEQVHNGHTWVAVHPLLSNKLVAEAINTGKIPELAGYRDLLTEQTEAGGSRIDLVLRQRAGAECWVEVKSTTLAINGVARFPDAITARGLKHLHALRRMVVAGHRAVIFFCVQRGDCRVFEPAREIDPGYTEGLLDAVRHGVEVLAYQIRVSAQDISINTRLPVHLFENDEHRSS